MSEKYIIDRFEGETAVCETVDEKTVAIDKASLPRKRPRGNGYPAGKRRVHRRRAGNKIKAGADTSPA